MSFNNRLLRFAESEADGVRAEIERTTADIRALRVKIDGLEARRAEARITLDEIEASISEMKAKAPA